MPETILIRYGELALKSPPVRREFERQLQRNILEQFVAEGLTCRLRSDAGHLYAEVDSAGPAVKALRRVFGVTSVSRVEEIPADPPVIQEGMLRMADGLLRPGDRFAVRARRTGSHPFTSQELARDLGAAILERFSDRELRVDLETPDAELFVEVRSHRAYLSVDRVEGPGGLPLGVAGRVVALVDGARGALGAYLLMKRGCRARWVTHPPGNDLVREVLSRFDPGGQSVEANGVGSATYRQLADLADAIHADGIVVPLNVDAFAEARGAFGERVVFSPTVGWTDAEVEMRWRRVQALVE
jgi:thiamine biosynthesis protein ThiI